MYLYCERSFFDKSSKTYEVVFDFNSKIDLEVLLSFTNNSENIDRIASTKTLFILNNIVFEKYRCPKAGYWYDIPLEFFEGLSIFLERNDYSLIMFTAIPREIQEIDFLKFRIMDETLYINLSSKFDGNHSRPKYTNFEDTTFYHYLSSIESIQKLELIVRDVGCGNWNEIKSEEIFLIYDLGGDIKFSDLEMRSVIEEAKIDRPFFGVISHWDLDHYRALLDLDDCTLKLMKNIIVPSKMPNTLQLRAALRRLRRLRIKVDIIKPSKRFGRNIELHSQGRVNKVELYRSSDGANINQSGIVLTIEGENKIGVLTGDHHYPQLYNGVFNTKSKKLYELVVPHHGGNAGTFNLTNWHSIPFSSGALSTKSKRYRNLPQTKIHSFFVGTNSFHCTECMKKSYSTLL